MKSTTLLSILLITITFNFYSQNSRPQEPKEPFGYNSEDIFFQNLEDSVMLAGTFTYPKVGSNFPSIILISGSGPQDRNSELVEHKSFLVIADYFTKNGIAVLRVDDRGTAQSEGDHNQTGIDGFVRDTKSALEYLKTRKEIDKSNIGLLGHSLGGIIAPIVANESNDIAYIILLAAPGMRGDKLMLLQKEKIERKMGVPEFAITMGQENMKGAYKLIVEYEGDQEELENSLKKYFSEVFGPMLPEKQLNAISAQMAYPWFVDFIRFEPETVLSNIEIPVFVLGGTNDVQVPAEENLNFIENILKENGNNEVKVMEMENLNHLFQESETGLPTEYAKIEQTFSPEVLKLMADWLKTKAAANNN